jgi:signal transduction histidine kinase
VPKELKKPLSMYSLGIDREKRDRKEATLRQWLIGKNDFDFYRYRSFPLGFTQKRAAHYQEVSHSLQITEWIKRVDDDGEDAYFMRRLLPVFDDNEELEMFIGYSLDITSGEVYRRELTEARYCPKPTSAKSEFLSKISHEIRTPTNAIIDLSRIFKNDNHDNTHGHYLQSVKFSADSLLRIINDALDFSKIEAGKTTFESIFFNFSHLIQGIH